MICDKKRASDTTMDERKKKVRQRIRLAIQPEEFQREINRLFISFDGGRFQKLTNRPQFAACYSVKRISNQNLAI